MILNHGVSGHVHDTNSHAPEVRKRAHDVEGAYKAREHQQNLKVIRDLEWFLASFLGKRDNQSRVDMQTKHRRTSSQQTEHHDAKRKPLYKK